MATKPDPVTLRGRYSDQAVADLEENRRRQAELLSHLDVLQQEETLLLDIIKVTGASTGRAGSAQHQSQATEAAATEPSPTAPASLAPGPGRPAEPGLRRGGSQRPLLKDLLVDLLRAETEPRSAKEIWRQCKERHPDRVTSNQVVRNTLEGLVARGRVARHKQRHTVMYTLAEPS
ncbi:hypothetical protein ABTZ93_41330 [Streptomyces sp. NPDC097941]|uniref:hypothetical protein n=1 Tax=Streptomyces sp. NPDC097941 TaxID=3155685 RepID=UPI00332D936A